MVTVRRSFALALWFLVLAAPEARGNGFAIPEIGTRHTAMGAVIGRPDDLSAIYHNPGGMVLTQGTNLYLNVGLALPKSDMKLRPWTNSDKVLDPAQFPLDAEGYYPGFEPTRAFGVIPMITASTNLFSEKWVGVLSFYVPQAVGAAFDEKDAISYHLIDSYIVAAYGSLGVGYRALDWLAVGISLNLIYARVHALRNFFPEFEGGKKNLSSFIGYKSQLSLDGEDVTVGFTFGALFQPLKSLSIGIALMSRSNVNMEGDVTVTLDKTSLFGSQLDQMKGRQETSIVLPWSLQAGANWDITPWLEVGAEIRYYFYREFEEQRTRITWEPSPVSDLVSAIVPELISPKNFRDSYRASGGFVVTPPPLPALQVMLGLHYNASPGPENTMSAEQPTFDHLGIHGGVRYRINRTFRLAFTYSHYFYFQRETTESLTEPPSNFRASGSNDIMTLVVEAYLGAGIGVSGK